MTYTLCADGGGVTNDAGEWVGLHNPEYLAWVGTGNTAAPFPVSPADLQLQLTDTVQSLMDAKSRAYHYDDLTTAVTYADEPSVPKFQEEGQAFRSWRSQVWATAYTILGEVQAGHRAFPTVSEVPSLLPPFPLDTP